MKKIFVSLLSNFLVLMPLAAFGQSVPVQFSRAQWVSRNVSGSQSHIIFRNVSGSGKLVTVQKIIVTSPGYTIGFRGSSSLTDSGNPYSVQGSEVGSAPQGIHTDRTNVPVDVNGSEILSTAELWGSAIPAGHTIAMGVTMVAGNIYPPDTTGVVGSPQVQPETYEVNYKLPPNYAIMIRNYLYGTPLGVTIVWSEQDMPASQ